LYPTVTYHLPEWITDEIGDPVFEIESGRLVAPAVNMVLPLHASVAHAEALSIMIAQQVCATHDLGGPTLPPMELVTSAAPCIQCYGNLWWSGLRRLVVGARKEDVEALTSATCCARRHALCCAAIANKEARSTTRVDLSRFSQLAALRSASC
jgi:tRNA(Arg) A34 adenosine deaminase TadA